MVLGNKIKLNMKEKVLLSIIFALCSYYSCGSNPNRIAWIEERFVNSIINDGIIHNEFLFPVEGFVCIHDKLYIQTYGGELNRIQFKKTDDGYMITNFEYLINLQIWPEWLVEKYSKSQIFYNIEGDKITINIKGPHINEEYCYISNIGGSKYGSILEIKGWLLDLLLANGAEPWPKEER
jgi:hypothetical protein